MVGSQGRSLPKFGTTCTVATLNASSGVSVRPVALLAFAVASEIRAPLRRCRGRRTPRGDDRYSPTLKACVNFRAEMTLIYREAQEGHRGRAEPECQHRALRGATVVGATVPGVEGGWRGDHDALPDRCAPHGGMAMGHVCAVALRRSVHFHETLTRGERPAAVPTVEHCHGRSGAAPVGRACSQPYRELPVPSCLNGTTTVPH